MADGDAGILVEAMASARAANQFRIRQAEATARQVRAEFERTQAMRSQGMARPRMAV